MELPAGAGSDYLGALDFWRPGQRVRARAGQAGASAPRSGETPSQPLRLLTAAHELFSHRRPDLSKAIQHTHTHTPPWALFFGGVEPEICLGSQFTQQGDKGARERPEQRYWK